VTILEGTTQGSNTGQASKWREGWIDVDFVHHNRIVLVGMVSVLSEGGLPLPILVLEMPDRHPAIFQLLQLPASGIDGHALSEHLWEGFRQEALAESPSNPKALSPVVGT
jgi:hypothetical protein